MEYSCLEGEGDREHYTEDAGGLKPNVANPATAASKAISASSAAQYAIVGCLRGDLNNGDIRYALETTSQGTIQLSPEPSIAPKLVELIDREVRLNGNWEDGKPGGRRFQASNARALAEGCRGKGK